MNSVGKAIADRFTEDLNRVKPMLNGSASVVFHGNGEPYDDSLASGLAEFVRRVSAQGATVVAAAPGGERTYCRLAAEEAHKAGGKVLVLEDSLERYRQNENGFAGHSYCQSADALLCASGALSGANFFLPGRGGTVFDFLAKLLDKRLGRLPVNHPLVLVGREWALLVEQLKLMVHCGLVPAGELSWFIRVDSLAGFKSLDEVLYGSPMKFNSRGGAKDIDVVSGRYETDVFGAQNVLADFPDDARYVTVIGSGSNNLPKHLLEAAGAECQQFILDTSAHALIQGGNGGFMEACAQSAHSQGDRLKTISFTAAIMGREQTCHAFWHRLYHCLVYWMRERAIVTGLLANQSQRVTLVYPGGVGTLREFFHADADGILIVMDPTRTQFWRPLRQFLDSRVEAGLMSNRNRERIRFVEDYGYDPMRALEGR